MQSFQYPPLDDPASSFRVIEVLPTGSDGPLRLRMTQSTIPQARKATTSADEISIHSFTPWLKPTFGPPKTEQDAALAWPLGRELLLGPSESLPPQEVEDDVSYRCLSYTWGDPTSQQYDIVLNDCTFKVRKNLYEFLHMARQYYPNLELWIDAICINQDDNSEKSEQVQRMADISRRI